MADDERVFGIREIDGVLHPSLPAGWLALLIGNSGSGAPVLAKQFAEAGVGDVPTFYYTTYERNEEVVRVFREYRWDADAVKIVNLSEEYYERVLVRGLEISRVRERGLTWKDLENGHAAERPVTSFNLTNRVLADLAAIDSPFRLVLDSLDFFLEVLEPREVMTVARQIRHRCQTLGGQALLSLHSLGHDRAVTSLLQDLADIVVELRAEAAGGSYAHWLLLQKVVSRPDLTRILPAEVSDHGWRLRAEKS